MAVPKNVLPQDQLAALLGIAESTLKVAITQGCPLPRNRKQLQEWPARWHAWRRSTMGAAGRPPNPVDKDLREIDRQIREVLLLERTIRVERLQGELISRTDVDDQRSRQVAAIRSRLFMIARRMRRALINATEQEIEDRLTEEFRAICADFAAGLEVPVDGNVAAAPAAAKQPAADVD